jgi:Spy/CpxP family protein refolding chaperone
MKLSRLNIVLYVGLIFLSGALVGVFGHRLYTVNTVSAKATRNPDDWRKRFVAEMETRLKLNSNQMSQLNGILDETRSRFHEVHEKYRPEMDSIREQQHGKIRSMLDEVQRSEFEKMRIERERNAKKGGGGPGPGL